MNGYDLVTLTTGRFALMRKATGTFFAWTGRGFDGAKALFAALHVPKLDNAATFATQKEAERAAEKYGEN